MRIGILTLPLHTNYGGILQAYALQTVLERMGHDVCLIEKTPFLHLPTWKAPLVYGKRVLKNMIGRPCPIFYEQQLNRKIRYENPIIRQNTDKFINKYIKRRIVNDFSEIKEQDFDAIVVGSDQVWRPRYFCGLTHSRIENAYLKFTNNWSIERVAYAVSYGTDEWEYTDKQEHQCAALLKKFNAVSVRENSACGLCKEHFGVDVKHVIDPTMLLHVEDYIKLVESAEVPRSPGNMLSYVLDETEEKTVLIEKVANTKGLVPFRVNSKVEDKYAQLSERIQPSVEQWLRGFYDAEFVITDSFHACVFSILYNKPFIAIGNSGRGLSRFTSLLSMFDLDDRILLNLTRDRQYKDINWTKVNTIMDDRREQAIDFLKLALSRD